MAIIIPENIVYREVEVKGNLGCPICRKRMIISGFMGQEVTADGLDTTCLVYTYCINCDKYFKSFST